MEDTFAAAVVADVDDEDESEVINEDELHEGLAARAAVLDVHEHADVVGGRERRSSAGGGLFSRMRGMFGSAASASAAPGAAAASARPPRPDESRAMPRAPDAHSQRVYRRRVDTNVVALQLGTLATAIAVATGDPCSCSNSSCGAMLSSRSVVVNKLGQRVKGGGAEPEAVAGVGAVIEDLADDQLLWKCEFCSHRNIINVDPEEIPTDSSVDYIEEVPATAHVGAGAGHAAGLLEDTSLVVFCVDVSGSMCVTTAVQGKMSLRGDHVRDLARMRAAGDSSDQYLPGEARGVTYVSRLQSVQAAISSQIEIIKAATPKRRVALVAFSGEVTMYGDCSKEPRVLAGDRLKDYNYLITAATEFAVDKPIAESADALIKQVFDLTEGGPTALGPAVVVATALASAASGSKIVVCTDGLANVGLGSIEDSVVPADAPEGSTPSSIAEQFYTRVGTYAVTNGSTIDVIGIEGDGCNLEVLGALSETTGGNVLNVNPVDLTKNFSTILTQTVVASLVSIRLLLHCAMRFENEEGVTGSKLSKEIGNVTEETQFSFEYGPRPFSELPPGALTGITELPFQVQIRFTRRDGVKCVRCITNFQPVTEDRALAEDNIASPVIAQHAAQRVAAIAQKGDYRDSRIHAMAVDKMLMRNIRNADDAHTYKQWSAQAAHLDDALATEEAEEARLGLPASEAFASMTAPAGAAASGAAVSMMRKERRGQNDKLSSALHMAKKGSPSMFKSPK